MQIGLQDTNKPYNGR